MKKEHLRSCGILIQCGNRYLLVHASKDWAPVLVDDGYWGFPKGCVDDGEDDKSTAIRETFEETGIDLSLKRKQIIKIAEYDSKNANKTYVVFKYVDEDQVLMNHKFHCSSLFPNDGVMTPEVDRFHWVTEDEWEKFVSTSHKGRLFTDETG